MGEYLVSQGLVHSWSVQLISCFCSCLIRQKRLDLALSCIASLLLALFGNNSARSRDLKIYQFPLLLPLLPPPTHHTRYFTTDTRSTLRPPQSLTPLPYARKLRFATMKLNVVAVTVTALTYVSASNWNATANATTTTG